MKTSFRAFCLTAALLSVSALAFAAIDGLSVKRQAKEGQIVKLRLKANLEIAGTQAVYTGLVQDKITKVDADGAYTEDELQIEGQAKIGDQTVTVPDPPSHPITYNSDGSLREIKGPPETSGKEAYRMTNLEVLIDAGKPLNVGDSWSVDIKADDKTGAVAAKADYKIVAEEKIGDIDCVKVKATVKETGGVDPASSDLTYWISKADGSQVKVEGKLMNAPFPGAPAPIMLQ
jgi:hypothetical protein